MTLSHRRMRAVAGAASVGVLLAAPAAASAKTTIFGSGSSAAQKYITALAAGYEKLHPSIKIIYNPDGGNAGVTDVQQHRSQFAIQTAAPVPADRGTTFTKLFLDALCIDVNSANRLQNTSLGTVKDIFTGVDTDWSQVSGAAITGTISPFGRNQTAGQYTYFVKSVLGGASEASNVSKTTSDGEVATDIIGNRDGIGYVGLAESALHGERALKIDGVACTAPNIRSKKYVLHRFDWGVLSKSAKASSPAARFLQWVQTSAAAGRIINKSGAVATFNK